MESTNGLTGEDESVVVGVGEGACGGSNGRAVGAAALCWPLRLPHAAGSVPARLDTAWIRACLPSFLRTPLPYCTPTPPRAAPAPQVLAAAIENSLGNKNKVGKQKKSPSPNRCNRSSNPIPV